MSNNERFIKIHTDANIIQNENKDHVNARRKTERIIKITYNNNVLEHTVNEFVI